MMFQQELVNWYAANKRELPWRNTTDAYTIWLSEIILQQTRVDQGLPYFEKFRERFPTVVDFSEASEQEVLNLWQGLGYYSRGRNMLHTAILVKERYQGIFPEDYRVLLQLKGIGKYTAAAIASFSSGAPHAVLDGNVYRVLSRYFGISMPIDMPAGQRLFADLAQKLIEGQDPKVYNQAIMEFGALVCTPSNPGCATCPVAVSCVSLKEGLVAALPVKAKKIKKRTRWFRYFIVQKGATVLMRQRQSGDIWQGLNDLPMIELSNADEPFQSNVKELFGAHLQLVLVHKAKHLLTHQTIFIEFFTLTNYSTNFNMHADWRWVPLTALKDVPMPIVVADFLPNYLNL